MSFNSEVSDLISRIKVAYLSKDLSVTFRFSKISLELSELLYRNGLIYSFQIIDSKIIIFRLKYKRNLPLMKSLLIVSSPGRRVYWNRQELVRKVNSQSFDVFYVLSTPSGLLTSDECLTVAPSGGELLLHFRVG